MVLETIGGGEIETGFWGPDTSKVQLGELLPITTPQFAGYASLTLAEVIPHLDPAARQEWAGDVHTVRERVEALPDLPHLGKFIAQDLGELTSRMDTVSDEDRAELLAALKSAAVPTEQAAYYCKNPFNVQPDGQSVSIEGEDGTSHVVTAEDFVGLTFRIMRGGMAGWDENGTYREIKDLAVHFDEALSRSA
jgi:hypothetical protein